MEKKHRYLILASVTINKPNNKYAPEQVNIRYLFEYWSEYDKRVQADAELLQTRVATFVRTHVEHNIKHGVLPANAAHKISGTIFFNSVEKEKGTGEGCIFIPYPKPAIILKTAINPRLN